MSAPEEKKEHPRPSLTADVVALLLDESDLRVLFPQPFSLDEARGAFEAILGAPLDPAAFGAELLREGLVCDAPPGASSPRYHAVPVRPDLRFLRAAGKK